MTGRIVTVWDADVNGWVDLLGGIYPTFKTAVTDGMPVSPSKTVLKDSATVLNGDKPQIKQTQTWAKHLAIAQRAKNKQRVKAIHAKIKHTRQDLIHKFTTQLGRVLNLNDFV